MIHVILASSYLTAAHYAKRERIGVRESLVITRDEDYPKLLGLSRDGDIVRIHTAGDPLLPQCWNVLRAKGLIK